MVLSNYSTWADLKEAAGIDTSTLVSKTGFSSLKTKVDNLGLDKIKTVTANLSTLGNTVENDSVKKLCMIN